MSDTRDLVPTEQPDFPVIPDLSTLLPIPSVSELTRTESDTLQKFQQALIIMGQAAGGALVCPGNQVGVADPSRCPYAAKCELLRIQKAPQGELCPIERELLLARFYGWCSTLGADMNNLREDQRSVISELTWLDIQEQRCTNILSRGEAARLTQISVKDSNPETGEWISWERVIHSNSVLLESLHTRKRMIMKEWLLTPEMKFKVTKAMGKFSHENDLGKKMSARADKLRGLVIDAEFTDVPTPK